MKITNKLLLVVALLIYCHQLAAYETTTHQKLSIFSANASVLSRDPTFLTDIGMEPYTSLVYRATNVATGEMENEQLTAADIIGLGAVYEDDVNFSIFDPNENVRPFRHFYDPQSGRGLRILGTYWEPSPRWALERLPITEQEFSYSDARVHYFRVFASSTRETRLAEMSLVLQTLGQVIHHIQDMGQPQHTRLDKHPSDPSNFYEYYSASQEDVIDTILASPQLAYPNPAVSNYFTTPIEYWNTPLDDNVPSPFQPHYKGMAEFTGRNFLSMNTMLIGSEATPSGFISNPDFYQPTGEDITIIQENTTLVGYGGETVTANIDFLVRPVFDELTNVTHPNVKVASLSVYDAHLRSRRATSGVYQRALTENSVIYDNLHTILIPRIAAFSTDFIDYFFRGRLDFVPNADNTGWYIKNLTSEDMTGIFTLFWDDNTGTRRRITNWTMSIPANSQSQPLTFTEPTGTVENYTILFEGALGQEDNAVAGKVKVYTPPAPVIPCNVSQSAAGGYLGYQSDIELGSTSGQVAVEFEAYRIPDAMYVTPANNHNNIIWGSRTLRSGFRDSNFYFDPATYGTTRVTAFVTGNSDQGTAWNFTVGCPGQPITNNDREYDRVYVTFNFGASYNSGQCYFDVFIDGIYKARINGTGGFSTYLTSGTSGGRYHLVEYRNIDNSRCTINSVTGQTYPVTVRDGSGTRNIGSPFFTNSVDLYIYP